MVYWQWGSQGEDAALFKTILVALDGTERDEALLNYIADLAHRLPSEVILLRSALYRAASGRSVAEGQLEAVSAAEQHLSRLEPVLRTKGIKVRSVVPYGGMAEAVVDNALLLGADAVALAMASASGPYHAINPAAASRNSGAVRKNRNGTVMGGACSRARPGWAMSMGGRVPDIPGYFRQIMIW